VWYAILSLATLAFAYRDHGLSRGSGILIIAAYLAFTASVLATGYAIPHSSAVVAALGAATTAALAAGLAFGRRTGAPGPDRTQA
jgi:hypothetical protein